MSEENNVNGVSVRTDREPGIKARIDLTGDEAWLLMKASRFMLDNAESEYDRCEEYQGHKSDACKAVQKSIDAAGTVYAQLLDRREYVMVSYHDLEAMKGFVRNFRQHTNQKVRDLERQLHRKLEEAETQIEGEFQANNYMGFIE